MDAGEMPVSNQPDDCEQERKGRTRAPSAQAVLRQISGTTAVSALWPRWQLLGWEASSASSRLIQGSKRRCGNSR